MQNLPWRFRESSFRKYEQSIASIVKSWPLPVVFHPTSSPETFSCRLRDAIKSLREHQWPTTILMSQFFAICDEIVVGVRGDTVIAGPESVFNTRNQLDLFGPVEQSRFTFVNQLEATNFPMLEWLAKGFHERFLVEPIEIVVSQLDPLRLPKIIVELQEHYDVAIEREGDSVIRML